MIDMDDIVIWPLLHENACELAYLLLTNWLDNFHLGTILFQKIRNSRLLEFI